MYLNVACHVVNQTAKVRKKGKISTREIENTPPSGDVSRKCLVYLARRWAGLVLVDN